MIQNRPAPRWLVATIAAIVLCFVVAAGYVGYLAYTHNTTPYERDSEQYNGWLYAEWNQLKDANQCDDKDGGWAEMGVQTSVEFVSGCQQWFKGR